MDCESCLMHLIGAASGVEGLEHYMNEQNEAGVYLV